MELGEPIGRAGTGLVERAWIVGVARVLERDRTMADASA
jgi:hypothetical protein